MPISTEWGRLPQDAPRRGLGAGPLRGAVLAACSYVFFRHPELDDTDVSSALQNVSCFVDCVVPNVCFASAELVIVSMSQLIFALNFVFDHCLRIR